MNVDDPYAAAVEIAKAARSPMERAAAALDPVRYRIFCAAYASMRVIDDFVDDAFLARPLAARAESRPAALATVRDWERQATAALTGGAAPPAGDRFRTTHAALAATHGIARLDPMPWRRLAGAMARDVEEAAMPDWDAFLAYAEGATAAPAAVFIEILALAPDAAGGRLESRLDGPAVDRIRNAAILLYLVHIMRDLAEDAAKGTGLLTLPETLFRDMGLDSVRFAALAPADPALVERARGEVARFAGRFLAPALAEIEDLGEALAPAEGRILEGLCLPYIERYAEFAGKP